ncbi:immunity protein YezG family protein [Paenibacillus xylanexedens]|uniref:immunity protein YezG family protein n=1 Tax=Paenibacillus xylanexedens TaxID=528191 RepID=UPI0011A3CE29|nr:immunity protein YezG family protein [Paenibacillus xylanexedens]
MKEFEERFSEFQADMIDICIEYVEDRTDKVYIYASCEEGMISSSFFYMINNKYVECHKVNDALEDADKSYDVTTERQFMVLRIINENIENIEKLCNEYETEMPTEMKLIYDATNGKFQAEYKYDLVHTNDELKTADDFADEWFEEIKSKHL